MTEGSDSTCPKSGLTVRSTVKLLEMPIFASSPAFPFQVLPLSANGFPASLGKVLTSPGAKTLALDPQLHRVFLPAVRQMDGQGRLKGEMMVIVVGMKE